MAPLYRTLIFLMAFAPCHVLAASSSWKLIPEQSSLAFSTTQVGQTFTGEFESFQASIRFDPDDLGNAHVIATIDMVSADAGDNQRNAALPTPDWFDVKTFPAATFEARTFVERGPERYEAQGTLTIRGIEKELVLPFSLSIEDDEAKMHGEATIVRTDFGVGQGQWKSGQWVGLDVRVIVDITATRSAE